MSPNETNQAPATPPAQPVAAAPKQKKTLVYMIAGLLALVVAFVLLYFANPGGIFTARSTEPTIVTITNTGFNPETVKIKKGEMVEWVNEDTTPHQVASDPYPDHSLLPHLFAETPLAQGESFSYTFDDAGTFTYHDNLKPADFHGTVIVE